MTDYKKLVGALRCKVGITEEETKCEKCPYGTGCSDCDVERYCNDAADAIEALQAEVERFVRLNTDLLKCNEELREAQTYIDHYGDKWMTSAKDVPTSAYQHGYADGRDEALSKVEPKRGRWTKHRTMEHDGDWYCSVCNNEVVILESCKDRTYKYPYCPNCGAKMEVQDGQD